MHRINLHAPGLPHCQGEDLHQNVTSSHYPQPSLWCNNFPFVLVLALMLVRHKYISIRKHFVGNNRENIKILHFSASCLHPSFPNASGLELSMYCSVTCFFYITMHLGTSCFKSWVLELLLHQFLGVCLLLLKDFHVFWAAERQKSVWKVYMLEIDSSSSFSIGWLYDSGQVI